MAQLTPQATRAYLVTVEGITDYFQRCSAPEDSLTAEEYADPSKGQMLRVYNFVTVSTVTLAKLYDPEKDGPLLEWMRQRYADRRRFSISITPVRPDRDGSPVPGAKALVLADAQLIRRRLPEADRQGSGLSMIEFELDFRSWAFQ